MMPDFQHIGSKVLFGGEQVELRLLFGIPRKQNARLSVDKPQDHRVIVRGAPSSKTPRRRMQDFQKRPAADVYSLPAPRRIYTHPSRLYPIPQQGISACVGGEVAVKDRAHRQEVHHSDKPLYMVIVRVCGNNEVYRGNAA
jgi:hypothetical protein